MENITSHDVEHAHHSSWISHVFERLEDAIDELNVDFPLSGGDPVAAHHHHHHHVHANNAHGRTEEERAEERQRRAHWRASLHHFLERDFPLSGGR